MTDNEMLICRSENRDLFEAWQAGEITFDEGAYIARRDRFLERCLRFGMPHLLLGRVYDALFERAAISGTAR